LQTYKSVVLPMRCERTFFPINVSALPKRDTYDFMQWTGVAFGQRG